MTLAIRARSKPCGLRRLRKSLAQAVEGRRRGGERNVDQSGDDFGVHRLQPQLRLVEAVLHAVARDQLALPRIRPAVIRTDDRAHVSGFRAAELRAAMAADVVERAHAAVRRRGSPAPAMLSTVSVRKSPGFGNLERESGEQPAAVPDRVALRPRRARRRGRTRAACRGRRGAWRGAPRVGVGVTLVSDMRGSRLRCDASGQDRAAIGIVQRLACGAAPGSARPSPRRCTRRAPARRRRCTRRRCCARPCSRSRRS